MPIERDTPISRFTGPQKYITLTDDPNTTEPFELAGYSQAKILIPAGFSAATGTVWEANAELGEWVVAQDYDQADITMTLAASKGVPLHPSLFTSHVVKIVLNVDNTATPVILLRRG